MENKVTLDQALKVADEKAEENKELEEMQLEYTNEKGKIVPMLLALKIKKDLKYKFYNNTSFLFQEGVYQKVDEKFIQQKIMNYLLPEQTTSRCLEETLKLLKINTFAVSEDTNKYLAVNNGIIHLDTLQFEEINLSDERRSNYLVFYKTNCILTDKSMSEEAFLNSRFYQYLTSTFDDELIPTIQQLMGMCLSPCPKKFQKCVFLLGEGSNGKSLLIDIIESMLDNNVSHVPMKDIDGNRFAIIDMVGKSVNIDADASNWRMKDTENYKKITVGDNIRAEAKNVQGGNVVINNLLLVALNNMPLSSDKSYGFVRRNLIIPFNKKFVDKGKVLKENESYKDMNLRSDIINHELDIVLAFALKGLKMIRENNYTIKETPLIEKANYEYQLENDSVLAFYEDNKNGKYYSEISAIILKGIYDEWCEENQIETPVGKTTFGKEAKKYWKIKRSNGIKYIDVYLNKEIRTPSKV